MSKSGRKATCAGCGTSFIARPRGPIPKHCAQCEPNKGNRARRRGLERKDKRPKGGGGSPVKPGVGGPCEAEAKVALAPLLVAAHWIPAGGDIETACHLAGLNPEALDLEALAREVELYPDVKTQSVDGIYGLGKMVVTSGLARLVAVVGDLPVGQLGSTLKGTMDAVERAQELFGVSFKGLKVVLDESDEDAA